MSTKLIQLQIEVSVLEDGKPMKDASDHEIVHTVSFTYDHEDLRTSMKEHEIPEYMESEVEDWVDYINRGV